MAVRCLTPLISATEDELLHGRLKTAINEGKVLLLVDAVCLNRPGSPAYSGLDGLVATIVPLVGLVVTAWVFGWLVGLASVIPWGAVFLVAGRLVLGRVNARACRFALASDAHLDELWRWGGIAFRTTDGASTVRTDQDWRNYARERC